MKSPTTKQPSAQAPELPEELKRWLVAGRDLAVEPEGAERETEGRRVVLPALGAAIRNAPLEARRQQRRQSLWWAAAAAAMVLCAGAGYQLNSGATSVVASQVPANLRQVIGNVVLTAPGGDHRIVTPDTHWVAGEELSTTAQAFVSVELGDQTLVDLSGATTVKLERIQPRDNAMFLRSGRVDINVPRIEGQARQLRVRTPDTSVLVLGTIFSVEVTERDERSVTTVRVSRGSVAVNHGGRDHVLKSGEQWSSFPAATAAEHPAKQSGASDGSGANQGPEQAHPSGAALSRSPDNAVMGASGEKPSPGPQEVSSLALQNWLFEQGLLARDRGDDKQAIRWFERLTVEFPDSPLLASSNSERKLAAKRLAEATP